MAKILTVSQLNNYIKGVFDDELILQGISVSGEIFQFKVAGGNSYITLKEGDCTLGCVFFSSAVEYAAGQKVCLTGSVRFYPKSGKVTFIVSHLQLLGRGELLAALEQVRQKLKADGIFDNNRPLPAVVTRVAIVTSEDGAVLHDFLSATKKMPYLSTVLYPVRVQGEGASGEISAVMSDIGKGVLRKDCVILGNLDGFSDFSDMSDMSKFCDFGGLGWSRGSSFGCVVSGFGGKTQAIDCKNMGFGAGFDAGFDAAVIARGGGSAADLDEFNSERLARAVFACGIPVISAVGHQTDYTLCDFAADIRAGTPSIAGEIIADNNRQFMQRLRQNMDAVFGSVVQSLDKNLRRTHRLAGEISHRIAARNQKAQNATMMNVLKVQNQLEIMLQKNRHKTKVVTQNVCDRLCGKAVDGKNKLGVLSARLEESNPLKILSKGYAKICKNGAEISAAGQLSQGDSIQVVMSDGRAFATVDDTELK